MNGDQQDEDLLTLVRDLEHRVAALEASAHGAAAQADARRTAPGGGTRASASGDETEGAERASGPPPGRPIVDPERFWALARLAERTGPDFERDGVAGSLLYAGRASTPGGGDLIWQEEHPLPGVLAENWEDAAAILAALGSPVRLEILRRLLLGGQTAGELQEIPGLGTSGQLYHHLRDLQAAGLVIQRRRGRYAVAPDKVVPALIVIAAAASMAAFPGAPGEPR